jgi:hypothetical protein
MWRARPEAASCASSCASSCSTAWRAVHRPVKPPPTMTRSAVVWPRNGGCGSGSSTESSQYGVVEAPVRAVVMCGSV